METSTSGNFNTKVFIASKMTTTAKQIAQKSGRKRRKTTTEKHNICIDLQAFLQACFPLQQVH